MANYISKTTTLMSQEAIIACCEIWAGQHPEPKTELTYLTPFQLLVAVMLSAQATDRAVNLVTNKLFASAPDPTSILMLTEEELEGYLQHLGLFRAKTRYLRKLSEELLAKYQGQVPSTQQDLEALPGIGRKTANVVRHALFGAATIAVDTHVFRVANRMGIAAGTTPKKIEEQLYQRIPPQYHRHAHHWLILHGRYTCQARRPKCQQCLVRSWCQAPEAKTG